MIKLEDQTIALIKAELEIIPEKYQKPFNSTHEGLAVLREEYVELEMQIFFGEKTIAQSLKNDLSPAYREEQTYLRQRAKIRHEAVQVAAMAIRIIQELT